MVRVAALRPVLISGGEPVGEADQAEQDRKALEAFVVNNADLERLEALLDRFNIFEAVGLVWQEIRHSAFLAFLLNPQESHSLSDAFAKRLLQEAVMSSPDASAPVTPIELSLWDLGQMEVRREWQRIDIFLLDERNRLAVIIENKIGAGEHGDQLNRYYEAVREQYPDYRLLALYLTPDGDEPSHPEYLPVNYRTVCEILDELAESRASITEPDLRALITHYTEMLRRRIVGDSEIAKLSRQIYQKHKRAIDLIIEDRYGSQERVREQLRQLCNSLLGEQQNFALVQSGKSKIMFDVQQWNVPETIFQFEFWNYPESLELKLFIGPGVEEVRQQLFQMVRSNREVFASQQDLGGRWSVAYNLQLLEEPLYSEATDAEREAEIRNNWDDFLEHDLPRIDAAFKQERWIWESSDGDIEIQHPDEVPDQYED